MLKKLLFYVPLTILSLPLFFIAAAWIEHKLPLTLPVMSGSYPVGRITYHWIDTARVDSTAPERGIKRELMVWIWYPAAKKVGLSASTSYLPAALRTTLRKMQGFVIGDLITSNADAIRTHSIEGAMPMESKTRYPVLLMKSGIGALAADYTTYAESLAAAGYIVVGSDAPYSTFVVVFPDGRIVKRSPQGHPSESGPPTLFARLVTVWSRDARFVLDRLKALDHYDPAGRFTGRMDLDHVGIFGHSFGGATALQFCADDMRCKAAANLDGQPFGSVIRTGTNKPLLMLIGDHHREPDSLTAKIKSRIARIVRSSSTDHYWYQVKGAYHFNFSDMALTKEKWISRLIGATGPIGSRRGLEVSMGCLRTFFDVYLKGADKKTMDSLPVRYSELEWPSVPLLHRSGNLGKRLY